MLGMPKSYKYLLPISIKVGTELTIDEFPLPKIHLFYQNRWIIGNTGLYYFFNGDG